MGETLFLGENYSKKYQCNAKIHKMTFLSRMMFYRLKSGISDLEMNKLSQIFIYKKKKTFIYKSEL